MRAVYLFMLVVLINLSSDFSVQASGQYYVGLHKKDFNGALADCKKRGGSLATINDSSENTRIFNLLKSKHAFPAFIGFQDLVSEGTWVWANGDCNKYTKWLPNEPNNLGGEDCVRMRNSHHGSWNDIKCSTKSFYVCEFSKSKCRY